MASFPGVDEVSSMLQRSFVEIQAATEALNKLDGFLEATDGESVDKLISKLAEGCLEQSEGCVEEGCLGMLSRIMQRDRVADFLNRADQQIRSIRGGGGGFIEGHNRKFVYSFINEYFDSSTKYVLAWLTEEAPRRSILSLPGYGEIHGLRHGGHFYDNLAAREFDSRYWIDVSGLHKIQNLLNIMVPERCSEQVGGVLRARGSMEKIDKVMRHSVERNRYVFVFDDDAFHREFWNVIKHFLRDNDEQNSIVSTVADDEVVTSFKRGSFQQARKLGPLSDAVSWNLFCKIAFRGEPEKRCPEALQQLSEEIVKSCKGFPLPIVGIAGLLSKREKQESEWERVRNCFTVEVKTSLQIPEIQGNPVHDLPDHLNRCFMYFGIFPPDSVIPNEKLFKLWIAEGFVQENDKKTLEEVAEEYLNELIRRNLVQSFQGLNRLERFCKLNRSLLSTTISNAYAHGFFDNPFADTDLVVPLKAHRLSLCIKYDVDPIKFNSDLRSLLVFGGVGNATFLIDLIRQCAKLTVLDFEYHPIEQLPEEFGNLIYLKYLSLKNTKLRKLPKSVDKLVNLQTLDVRNTLLAELPVEINMLTNLRHLLASVCDDGISVDPTQGVRLKKGIGMLHNLHTLTTVEAHENDVGIIKEIAAMNQLRTLGISRLSAKMFKAVCACVEELTGLKSLTLQATNGEQVLNLARISSFPLLQRLVLKGVFRNPPFLVFHSQILSVLCLSLTQLTEDQLIHLSLLPNLVTLWLCRAYKGDRLYFKQGSFKKLKILVLRELHGLYELEIEDGALPCLEELRIGSSPFFDQVTSGIQYLKNLKILINYDMPKDFAVRMQPNGGSDYWKVKHIPCVFFLYGIEGRDYKLYELGDLELVDHFEGSVTSAYRITEPQDEHEFTFCKSSDKDKDVVGPLSFFYRAKQPVLQKDSKHWSFSSSTFTDDVEM